MILFKKYYENFLKRKVISMIKFLDLHKINERFRSEIDQRIKTILDKGWYLLGDEDKTFEKHFAEYCEAKHCIGCANGLDALNLIIRAYGLTFIG